MENKQVIKLERQMAAYEKYIKAFTPNSVKEFEFSNYLIIELKALKLEYICLCNHLSNKNKQVALIEYAAKL